MTSFDEWRASECAMLGTTKEEHDKLIELTNKMSVATGGNAYGAVSELIRAEKWRRTRDALSKLGLVSWRR